MSQKAPRIPDQIWNQHKETIIPFYKATSLPETMEYMAGQHGFRATKNQYTDKLKKWGIEKNHPTSDWAIIHSKKRKRSEEGKKSDVYIRKRKYTEKEQGKEIARHVPLGREWCYSEDVQLPDYITVCTPKGEVVGIHRDFLLRDLPWYKIIQHIQAQVSGTLRADMALSTSGTFLERAIAKLDPQWETNLPTLTVWRGISGDDTNSLSAYLPPEDLDISNFSTARPTGMQQQSPLLILEKFLRHFIFLSVNNIFGQWGFNKVYEWIVENGGTDILIFLCQLRSPLMEVFVKKVFLSAVESGNVALGRRVLQGEACLDTGNPSQRQFWTDCLSSAVYHRNEAVVELLCQMGVRREINWRPWKDDENLHLPSLQTLLDYGAHPDTFVKNEGTGFPLIDAALKGNLDAVKLLLNKGAGVDLCLPKYYGTALQAAVSRGHSEVVKYLIRHGADTNPLYIQQIQGPYWELSDHERLGTSILTPVQIAAKMDNLALIQILLQYGASAVACPVSEHPGIIPYICHSARKEVVSERKRNSHYHTTPLYCTALQYGVVNQNLEVVALLLSAGASPNAGVAPGIDDTPLQMSTRLGNVAIFQVLWSWHAGIHTPAVTYDGRTAMQGAAESGNWEIMSVLLRAGAQINEPAGAVQGMTALQAACVNGHYLMAGALLARGADANADPSPVVGRTPIQAAAARGDIGVVQDLIALGAKVNAPATEGGMTALLGAIDQKSLPLLELLVHCGADVNATGNYGFESPLTKAVSNNWFEGAQFLLRNGANPDGPLVNDTISHYWDVTLELDLLSPLGWAIVNNSEQMVALLLQHGADALATACFDYDEGALIFSLSPASRFEVTDLLLRQVPDLEKHPGWDRALGLVLIKEARPDTDPDVCGRILDKIKALPPLLRQKAAQTAWDIFVTDSDGLYDGDEALPGKIALLIELGASIDYCAPNGKTLLARTAHYGYESSCSYLISRGAAINTRAGRYFGTPLQQAIRERNIDVANLLIDHGADINALPAEYHGVTALQAASINGLFELAIRLLEGGADVSAPAAPQEGRTAIDGAAERGNFDMVKLLLNAYPEDVDLEPVHRQAAGYAEKQGYIDLAAWLRER